MNRKYLRTGAVVVAIAALAVVVAVFMILHEPTLPVVYIVYDSPKGDLSYTDSAYRGLFAAQEEMQFNKKEFTSLNYTEFSGLPDNSGGLGKPGLIITVGYDYAGDTQRLAAEHPEIRFLGIDQAGTGAGNLKSYEITSYGVSYLAGVLAASATKTHRVGIILGAPSALLEGFRQGYITGVHAIDPAMTVDQAYIGDNSTAGFSDPDKAGEIAGGMYLNGTDVIFTVAGYSGTGAIAEAKKVPGRYIIGVDSDQTYLGPSVVLASAIKRVDLVVYSGIGEYLNGTFTGGSTVAGLHEGITGLVYNPKFVSYNTTVSAWEEKAQEEEALYLAARK
jgi:basic membrane protein A and related proteins